jgi:hypothetical protein
MARPTSAAPAQPPPTPPDDHEELIEYLERDQLVSGTMVPVAPARLSGHARAGLWALRVFAVVVSAMVVYTFVAQLG